MTSQQLTLAPVHAKDQAESRAAAAKVDAQRQYEQVMVALLRNPEGLTDDELAERCGLLRNSAGTRRGIASKRGFVVDTGRTRLSVNGNPAQVRKLTESGRVEAARIAAEFVEGMTQ